MNLQDKISWLSQFYESSKLLMLTDIQLDELYNNSQPVDVQINSLEHVDTCSYKIHSPDGYVSAHEWRNKGTKPCVKISTKRGKTVIASTDHFFEMSTDKWKYASYITPGEHIKTESGMDEILEVSDAGAHTVYDFHIDHSNHRYYTNGISSHNSGAGKSLFLANLGVNWALQGLNVVYLTLELSEELVSMRIDSMITEISTRDVFKQLDEVEMRVKVIGKKAGTYQVKYMPSGKTTNDIRSYLKEYEVKLGRKVDVLLIDYLDLLMPISKKISAENLFIKDKFVSEELRNLAMEKKCIMVTASQLNRGAVEEVEFDHSHISGGLSKIQTADNVFGIFTSRAMRERGKYQIQLMKTRSSSGVGQKIELDFNDDTLRITDPGEAGQSQDGSLPTSKSSSAIMSNLQRTSVIGKDEVVDEDGVITKVPKAHVEGTRLRSLLNNLDTEF